MSVPHAAHQNRASAPGQLLPAPPTAFAWLSKFTLAPAPASAPVALSPTTAATAPARGAVTARELGVISIAGARAVRWNAMSGAPIRVRVENAPNLEGWSAADTALIANAFGAWERDGAPVRFVLDNSPDAEVVVHWVDHFDGAMSGWTTVSWDNAGRIYRGDVRLALRTKSGDMLTPSQRLLLATHEFGHVLGLGHNGDTSSIMSAVIYARAIGHADVLSVQRLYGMQVASR